MKLLGHFGAEGPTDLKLHFFIHDDREINEGVNSSKRRNYRFPEDH